MTTNVTAHQSRACCCTSCCTYTVSSVISAKPWGRPDRRPLLSTLEPSSPHEKLVQSYLQ